MVLITITIFRECIVAAMQPLQTCDNYRLAKGFQHERQGRAGVGQGVRPMEDHKPDDDGDDDDDVGDGEEENDYV